MNINATLQPDNPIAESQNQAKRAIVESEQTNALIAKADRVRIFRITEEVETRETEAGDLRIL